MCSELFAFEFTCVNQGTNNNSTHLIESIILKVVLATARLLKIMKYVMYFFILSYTSFGEQDK